MDSGEFDLGMSEISAGDAPYPSKPSKAGEASTRAIGMFQAPGHSIAVSWRRIVRERMTLEVQ